MHTPDAVVVSGAGTSADPRRVIGPGACASLVHDLQAVAPVRLALVIDPGAWEASGAAARLEPTLRAVPGLLRFSAVRPNPDVETCAELGARLRETAAEVVVAVGGGSAIDTAKAGLVASAGTDDPLRFLRSVLRGEESVGEHALGSLWAVPTTAGTGAEATHFSAVYDAGTKHSLAAPSLRPARCYVDSELTASLPRQIVAASAADAVCQALESLWARGSTPSSRVHAAEAARLAVPAAVRAVRGEGDLAAARADLSRAAHLSGCAIDVSKTTAPHALSYAVTQRYGVPHGHAVALMFGPVLAFHLRHGGPELIERLRPALPRWAPERWEAEWRAWLGQIGLAARLRDVGVPEAALDDLAVAVNAERVANNPVQLSAASLRAICRAAW